MRSTTSDTQIEEGRKLTITGMLMALEGFLKELSGQASDALSLYDIGEKNELILQLEKSIDDPLKTMSDINESFKAGFLGFKEQLITKFVASKSKLVERGFMVNDDGATQVFISLNTDTDESREVFYDLLDKYEKKKIFDDYPIIFHFINTHDLDDAVSGIEGIKKIPLDGSKQIS
jgi:hypothetical protein